MRLRTASLGIALAIGVASTTLAGCDFFLQPTKTAEGQLYQSGDGRYDPYFAAVHREQVAAASWPEESKSSRKPIVSALDLRPGVSSSTILAATRAKKGEGALGSAIDQTTTAERERARRLSATAAKLDDLKKRGEELKRQTVEDRKNLGADKADDKKVEKKNEVRREMAAAVDAVDSMASDARRAARDAEDLASKLRAAWTGKEEDERTPAKIEEKDDRKEEKKKPEPVVKKAPKPDSAPAKRPPPPKVEPEDKPAKPAPAQKPPDEVFNP